MLALTETTSSHYKYVQQTKGKYDKRNRYDDSVM